MTNPIFIKMVLDEWHARMRNADTLLDKLTDEQLQKEVAPNRNRGIYIVGHLTAVHDRMLPVLGFGDRFYPHLDELFITNPDKVKTLPPASELRGYWKNINATLANHFKNLQADEWFQRHNSVSAEDFIKEPHRNKLNLIINRTNHMSYHSGQLIFLKEK